MLHLCKHSKKNCFIDIKVHITPLFELFFLINFTSEKQDEFMKAIKNVYVVTALKQPVAL